MTGKASVVIYCLFPTILALMYVAMEDALKKLADEGAEIDYAKRKNLADKVQCQKDALSVWKV